MSHNQQRETSNYRDTRPSLRTTRFTRTEHAQLAAYLVSRTALVLDQFPMFGIRLPDGVRPLSRLIETGPESRAGRAGFGVRARHPGTSRQGVRKWRNANMCGCA